VPALEAPDKSDEFGRTLAGSSTGGIESDVRVSDYRRLTGVSGNGSAVAIKAVGLTFESDRELTRDLHDDTGDVAHGSVGQIGYGLLPHDIVKDDAYTGTGHCG
jgi:hypothetical protein